MVPATGQVALHSRLSKENMCTQQTSPGWLVTPTAYKIGRSVPIVNLMPGSELWNPAASHTYASCGRKNEPINGRCSRTEYMLWDGDVKVLVCVTFWKETFGLGLRALRTLVRSANSYKLAEYRSKGQKKNGKRVTMPRIYCKCTPSL